ncbi:MAG: beta-glucosidase [Oscillospiraceae bacterium]|nr:beta-glucosidase [Oscillospiraceae bacterium]
MKLREKISLCSGQDAWSTKAFPASGIPALRMSDGPHGLRKMRTGSPDVPINESLPATCFPTAVTTACTWNEELLAEVGKAIGEEAAAYGVGLLLGPGANIKRNPLCGRNFEYFSEDPLLSGKMAAAFIRGVESTGVSACVKHFACNNQEYRRFTSDSLVDERTLREIYLRSFEIAVREGKPSAVMCAYNKLNGVYCSDNRRLLTEILREEWGFDGLVVTDWGALHDRAKAFEAGCDLAMPGGSAYLEREAERKAIRKELNERFIDESAARIVRLAKKAQRVQNGVGRLDAEGHRALARRAAAEGAVLLKNDKNLLPLAKDLDVILIGPMAEKLRIQGAGSSHVAAFDPVSPASLLPDAPCFPGCLPNGKKDGKLLKEAVKAAKKAGVPVIFAGLPDTIESEGFDRENLSLPDGVNELIEAVAAVNPHTVVVLIGGSPVELPWFDKVKALLYLGLPGEVGAEAAVDLLYGKLCPSGKLAESWPLRYRDCVCSSFYGKDRPDAQYREGVYVGYRYYASAGVPVRFPFGYGLSYTRFRYSDLRVEKDGVSFRVKNIGKCDGAEVAQLYIAPPPESGRPVRELRGFRKVFLKRGAEATLRFPLDDGFFSVWDGCWVVPAGRYTVLAGGSSEDLPLSAEIEREGDARPVTRAAIRPGKAAGENDYADFERLLGRPIIQAELRKGSFTMDNTPVEMQEQSLAMRLFVRLIEKEVARRCGGDRESAEYRMSVSSSADASLRSMKQLLGFDDQKLEALLALANGKPLEAIRRALEKTDS